MIKLLLVLAALGAEPSEQDIAMCTGVSNAMQDTGVATAASEPVLVFYGDKFNDVLKKRKTIPESIINAYTRGYSVGLTYSDGKLGELYWTCVSSAVVQ